MDEFDELELHFCETCRPLFKEIKRLHREQYERLEARIIDLQLNFATYKKIPLTQFAK